MAERDAGHLSPDFRSRTPVVTQTSDGSGIQGRSPFLPGTGRKRPGSEIPLGGNFSGDDLHQRSMSEPGLLLQIETRPISHEQLSCPERSFDNGIEKQSSRQFSPLKDHEDHRSVSPPGEDRPVTLEVEPELLLQPETRPISYEQLVVEVKGIYAGLVMVEAKCIDINERQSAAAQEKEPSKRFDLKNDQWQSLIALHKQVRIVPSPSLTKLLRMTTSNPVTLKLLHEHYDFFSASQHPSASAALSRLVAIRAPPLTFGQLSLYPKSLTAVNPSDSAKGSIMTILHSISYNKDTVQCTHYPESLNTIVDELEEDRLLDKSTTIAETKFKKTATFSAIANIAGLFGDGSSEVGTSRSTLGSTTSAVKSLLEKPGMKIKQGLAGFVNGSSVSAIADTDSRKNVISASYAARLGLEIEGSPSSFILGSSRKTDSLGTVSLLWSFAENPEKTIPIICHVLPTCIYDLILGNGFLKFTETLSKYRNRFSECVFSTVNKLFSFAFLGDTYQRLQGMLADTHDVSAVPDTGAERNVMGLQYAIAKGSDVQPRPKERNWLQLADGSF